MVDKTKTAHFTGHRPSKLNKYDKRFIKDELLSTVKALFLEHEIDTYIVGGAIGLDQMAADTVLYARDVLGMPIKLVIYEPFKDFTERWVAEDVFRYRSIREKADEVKCISDGPYSPQCYFERNKAMVEDSAWTIAVWDGSPGGTAHDVKLSQIKGNKRVLIDPRGK